jgi:hypothetical protein
MAASAPRSELGYANLAAILNHKRNIAFGKFSCKRPLTLIDSPHVPDMFRANCLPALENPMKPNHAAHFAALLRKPESGAM